MGTDSTLGARKEKPRPPSEPPIYNCHIHVFTKQNVPRYFLRFRFGFILGSVLSLALRWKPIATLVSWIARHPSRFAQLESLHRYARFVLVGNSPSATIFEGIQRQYPKPSIFVALAMDMSFMNAGPIKEPTDVQHEKLLTLGRDKRFQGHMIPFYAVDPRQPDIVRRVRANLARDKFRGVKIYPNFGYRPDDKPLMQVYEICEKEQVPVMTHCSAGGVWKFGLPLKTRQALSHPHNYIPILETFPRLRLCLAHYGDAANWERQLKARTAADRPETWVKCISEMISSGEYPNLYTDIAMTLFFPKAQDLYFDFFDYLKVLLADPCIREHVLYGSDYYMAETAPLSEKQVSLGLRSRLGEELYFQIAHYNPRRYLGLPRSGDWKKPRA